MGRMGLLMAELQCRKAVAVGLPVSVMGAAAAISTWAGSLFQGFGMRAPSWNLDKYREARQVGWLCDGQRMSAELGFVPHVPLREGLSEAIKGYKTAHWL